MSLTDPSALGEGDIAKLEMKLMADKEAKTLTLRDRGCGMSKDDLINQLGTVAQSGTSSFIEAFSEGADVMQFGSGGHRADLEASKVRVGGGCRPQRGMPSHPAPPSGCARARRKPRGVGTSARGTPASPS